MKIKDVMTATPSFILSTTTAQEAAQKMQQLDCGFLPVGSNDKIVGIVTDRDIALRVTAQGLSPSTKVSEIASKKVLYCYQDDSLDSIIVNMAENQVRRLIVLGDKKTKRLVGVVSLADIVLSKGVKAESLAALFKAVSGSKSSKTSAKTKAA